MILTRGILAFLPSSIEKGACSIKEDRTRTHAILLPLSRAFLLSSSPSTGLSLTEQQQATWSQEPAGSKAKKTDIGVKKRERSAVSRRRGALLPLEGRLVRMRGGNDLDGNDSHNRRTSRLATWEACAFVTRGISLAAQNRQRRYGAFSSTYECGGGTS